MENIFLKTHACTVFLETFDNFNEKNIERTITLLESFNKEMMQSEYNELKKIQKHQLATYAKLAFQNKEKESKEYLEKVLSKTGMLVQHYEKARAVIDAITKINKFNSKQKAR